MFMTRSLNVTPKTTEQHLIVGSDKSVAYVTNNKRLHSTFSTIEAKLLTDTNHRAASLRQQSYLFIVDVIVASTFPPVHTRPLLDASSTPPLCGRCKWMVSIDEICMAKCRSSCLHWNG